MPEKSRIAYLARRPDMAGNVRRLLRLILVVVLLVGASQGTTLAAPASWDYVALGDSLATGFGAFKGYVPPLRSADRDRHWGGGHMHKPRPERMDQFSTALCPPQRSDVPARHPRGGDRHLEYRRERPQGSPQLLQERDLRWGRQPGLPPGWRGETQDQLGRHHGGGSRVACDQQHHRTNNGYLQPLRQDRQNLRHLAERRRDERLPGFQALCRRGQLSHRHHLLHMWHTLRRVVSDLQRDDWR